MKTFSQLKFESNPFIINSRLLKFKIWTSQLTRLLINSRNCIEFHSKLYIYIYIYILPFKSMEIMTSCCFFIHTNVKEFKPRIHLMKFQV